MENFQNSVPKGFIATPIDVLCSNFLESGRREIGKDVGYLPDKKAKFHLSLQISLVRGSRPKSVKVNIRQCTQSASDFTHICSLSTK